MADNATTGSDAFATLEYQTGFGNEFATEVLEGALPKGQNTPQKVPYGLYAEQLSGTPFTVPRADNERSWLYRILPSVRMPALEPVESGHIAPEWADTNATQLRWLPFEPEDEAEPGARDFVSGLRLLGGAGDPAVRAGVRVLIYIADADMVDKAFCNADGDYLIVPQEGILDITTEFGRMRVEPNHICVIQRGIRFAVARAPGVDRIRGYICEVFDGHFKLPELAVIGANGLANARDFETPVAWYEDRDCDFTVVHKFLDTLHATQLDHSPFDVVAWHGNYAPYRYDLANFCAVNSVTFDHLDPSTFVVLTAAAAGGGPGVAACDFAIFPPRWVVQEHTFRPPYFHRNCMSEFMGLVYGEYEAKKGAFLPGGATLHSCMTPHGPDAKTFAGATADENLVPTRVADGTQAFMFESYYILRLTPWATESPHRDADYNNAWMPIEKNFDPNSP